ncbi:BrnT family toxin [Robbsia sp. KACC 23696]|uniref:BrnT family toxin n=1 Tax=Robbsia sp. KACC 23696 TaxID=3149231 RepID=UPI00325B7467
MSFNLVEHFDFETALTQTDDRKAYPETRYQSLGFIGDRLCMVVFTLVESTIRVISLRKANAREVKRYEQET